MFSSLLTVHPWCVTCTCLVGGLWWLVSLGHLLRAFDESINVPPQSDVHRCILSGSGSHKDDKSIAHVPCWMFCAETNCQVSEWLHCMVMTVQEEPSDPYWLLFLGTSVWVSFVQCVSALMISQLTFPNQNDGCWSWIEESEQSQSMCELCNVHLLVCGVGAS